MNIGKAEEPLNITNINLRSNKTWEIILSPTQVLEIFLTTAATSASAERANSKELVAKVSGLSPTLCSNNPANS